MPVDQTTSQITAEINQLIDSVEQKFLALNSVQLNWKKNASTWSIAQCFEHLIVSNQKYLETFDLIQKGKFKPTFWQTLSPFTNSTGKNMIKTLGVNVSKKFQAPKLFLPSKKIIRPSIVQDFINQQVLFSKIADKLSDEKFKKTVISSPVAGLITINLQDAIRIMIVHAQRHLAQAEKAMREVDFQKP